MQWTTVERGRPAARWGLRPGEHTGVALASLDTYTRGDMCGGASASLHVNVVLRRSGLETRFLLHESPAHEVRQGVLHSCHVSQLPLPLTHMLAGPRVMVSGAGTFSP